MGRPMQDQSNEKERFESEGGTPSQGGKSNKPNQSNQNRPNPNRSAMTGKATETGDQ
ncbi:MAG: hypothetical protein AB7G80_07710 [Dongiaceae bacterium]